MHLSIQRRGWLILASVAAVGLAGWQTQKHVPTGERMTKAAEEFVKSLTDEQRKVAVLPFEAKERLDWHFIPKDKRKGLDLNQMEKSQRERASDLLRATLSPDGVKKTIGIMQLETLLAELEKSKSKPLKRDPLRYYFTIFGTPDAKSRWGLSVEGHHLSLNFVVDKNEVVSMTPMFFGANPARILKDYSVGPKAGTRYLPDEEDLAFKLRASFTRAGHLKEMTLAKVPSEIRGAGEPTSPTEEPVGIKADSMSDGQKAQLRALIASYTAALPRDVATEVKNDVERGAFWLVRFAWAGATQPGKGGHYYRIEGTNFVIEYCNTQADSEGNPANHVHAVLRITKGQHPDFGVEPVKPKAP